MNLFIFQYNQKIRFKASINKLKKGTPIIITFSPFALTTAQYTYEISEDIKIKKLLKYGRAS